MNVRPPVLFSFDESPAHRWHDKSAMLDGLRNEFKKRGIVIPANAVISAGERAGTWAVADGKTTYLVEKTQGKLHVYVQRKPDRPAV